MHNIACMCYVLSYMQIRITRYRHNGMEWGAVANWHSTGLDSQDPFYAFSGICAIISQHPWHSFETFKGKNRSLFDIMHTYLCKMVFVAKTVDNISLQISNGQSLAIKCSLHPGLRRICTEVSLCAPERGLRHQYPTRTIPCTFQSPALNLQAPFFKVH